MKKTRRVGKYEVGKTIGEGTFAKVKYARNTETGESVAMKILAKSSILQHKMVDQVLGTDSNCFLLLNPSVKKFIAFNLLRLSSFSVNTLVIFLFWFQIKREISIMKIVRHPNIVRLHEVCLYSIWHIIYNNSDLHLFFLLLPVFCCSNASIFLFPGPPLNFSSSEF